jgi:DNA replication initiation complex subunit (GINS family)
MADPYSQLLEWRRSEGAGRGLAKLPKEFYETTRRYLAETRATFEAELRENPSSKKGELARQTYQRAHQISRDIVEARMTKILSQAFQATVGGTREIPNALAEERTLFDALLAQLRSHRQAVAPFLEPLGLAPEPISTPSSGAPTASRPTSAPAAPAAPPAAPVRDHPPPVDVRVLKDGRPIALGQESLEIRKEDVLSVPEETAQLLVAAGLAERLAPARPPNVT